MTADTYTYSDGTCHLDQKSVNMTSGAFQGEDYCQVFVTVEMGECDGCPDNKKRVELYSDSEVGCGTEFYGLVEPDVEVITTDPDDPDHHPTFPPVEPEGSLLLTLSLSIYLTIYMLF